MTRHYKDDDGTVVKHGDTIHFSYGLPPIGVDAKVKWNGHRYMVYTPGHNPESCALSYIKRYFNFYITNTKRGKR